MPAHPILALIIGGSAALLEPRVPGARPLAPPPAVAVAPSVGDGVGGARWGGPSGVRQAAAPDTARRRRAVEISDWYERRLLVHRVTAYAIPALFAFQWYEGQRLYDAASGTGGSGDARSAHKLGAGLITGAFAINAVTGAWNLWDSRAVPEGRTARILHTVSILAASGGFTYAGLRIRHDVAHAATYEDAMRARRNHRGVALASMGVTLVSGAGMWIANHR